MFSFADPSSDPIAGPVTDEQLDWSARVAVGLDKLADDYELDGLTYYYRGADNEAERLGAGVIVGNSLLTARGVITSGEGDLKTNIAQVLLDRLGAGGSFTEYYALDFDEDFVLMGHDGPGHIAIAQEQPTLRALKLFHGKRGAGLSVEFKVRYGPITIVGCTQTAEGRLKLIVAEGESIARRDVPDRQHQQPAAVLAAARRSSSRRGASTARRTTSRSASATSRARSATSRVCWTSSSRRSADMERVCFQLHVRPERIDEYRERHRGRLAGDARRAQRGRLDATTRCSCAPTGC